MAGDRTELEELRRLDELESRAAPKGPMTTRDYIGAAIEPNIAMLGGMVSAPVSGLAGLAGTILPGPPEQGAKWTQAVQQAMSYKPRTEGGRIAIDTISSPFRAIDKGADWYGGRIAETEKSPAAGAAAKTVLSVGLPALLAQALRFQPANEGFTGATSKKLMQSAIKPAPQDLRTGKADQAIQTMLDEGINPTRGGMEKARRLAAALDDQVEEAIRTSNATVDTKRVAARLQPVLQRVTNQVNPQQDINAVTSAYTDFTNSPMISGQRDIPVQTAHALKKGTYAALGGKSYGEIGSSSVEAQKALARGLREETGRAVPNVLEPLKRESALMNVHDVAVNRALAEANKNPLSLGALRIGDNPLSTASFLADRSALAKALAARLIYGMGDPRLAKTGLVGSVVNQNMEDQ